MIVAVFVYTSSDEALCAMPQERALQSATSNRDRSQVSGSDAVPTDQTNKLCQWELSQGSESTYSSSQFWTDAQSRSSLTSHIEATDALPVDWNSFKRKKLSEGDITDLQNRLELDHNVRQRRVEPRRPSELDPSTLIDADLQRRHNTDSNLARLVKNLHSSTLLQDPLRWTQDTPKAESWQRRIVDQISSFTHWLGNLASALFVALLRFLYDCTRTFGQTWKMCWPILRWPLVFLVTFLIALNATAFAYTVTHEAFLSNFCVKELPLVRNWMCSAWDKRLQPGSVEETGSFLDPLGGILDRNGSTSSYVLPHILARYQSIVRSFKVNLPVSQFSATDQQYLREQFTQFINQSDVTIQSSQDFHAHIMGTIDRVVSNTPYYIDKISEYNPTSFPLNEKTLEITFEADDSLSKSMAWFNSHYMVFLPAGLEPFRQRVVRIPYAESVYGLQKHIAAMRDRLTIGIDMALTLQNKMKEQRWIGEKIEERVALSRSENNVEVRTFQHG